MSKTKLNGEVMSDAAHTANASESQMTLLKAYWLSLSILVGTLSAYSYFVFSKVPQVNAKPNQHTSTANQELP